MSLFRVVCFHWMFLFLIIKLFLADNGSLYFWDWKTGYNFQRLQTIPQPGSIDPEMGIYAMKFDHSGSRLITCEADKTIKIYKEDETAVNIIEIVLFIFELLYF